jgi:hypothetical protein
MTADTFKPANDNGFVQMLGGGNTNPTQAMLERMHDDVSYVNPNLAVQKSSGAFNVYVIGSVDPEFIKIGKAGSVVSRLRSIQTGNPLKLYVHRIFGFDSTRDATRVEAWAHQDAARIYGGAVGEWFSCGPVEAHILIADICENERIKCCIRTPEIEQQWRIDEPVGQAHLKRLAEWRQRYWGDQARSV